MARTANDLEVRPLTQPEAKLVDDIKSAGNHFFGMQHYRDAELLYRSGLGFMALGPEGMATGCSKCNQKRCIELDSKSAAVVLSPEDNRRAATLFLNLAQTLLNLPRITWARAAAPALEAATVCYRAEAHLFYMQMQQIKETGKKPRSSGQGMSLSSQTLLGRLVVKAMTRRAVALERCANVSGAMMELIWIQGGGPEDEEHLEQLEFILRCFCVSGVGRWMDFLPQKLWELVAMSKDCHHHASVDIAEMNAEIFQDPSFREFAELTGFKAHHLSGVFCCGPAKDQTGKDTTIFVARVSGGATDKRDAYVVLQCRRMRDSAQLGFSGAFLGKRDVPYTTGAVIRNMLFCLALTQRPDVHMVCYLLTHPTGGFQGSCEMVPVEFVDEEPVLRDSAIADVVGKLVACNGELYLFGGIEKTRSGREKTSDELLKFVPHFEKRSGHVRSIKCMRVIAEAPPRPRFGHATFVRGDQIYIFGGTDGTDDAYGRQTVYGDMMCFNVKTKKWRQIEQVGSRPCARSSIGIASDGDRAVIVGGWTNARKGAHKLPFWWLADVWEFHFDLNCWIQVVPRERLQPWIAGRQSAACGLLGDGTLVTLGGFGPGGTAPNRSLASFTWTPGAALEFHAGIVKQGPWRDLAAERACEAVVDGRFALAHMPLQERLRCLPEKLQALLEAPAGSVTLFTTDVIDIFDAAIIPTDEFDTLNVTMPMNPILSPDLKTPLWPLNSTRMWGSEQCPFNLAPRWLTSPSEVSANLVSGSLAGDAPKVAQVPLALRHTVKIFGTVKAAVEFFRLCQPDLQDEPTQEEAKRWHPLKGIGGVVEELDALFVQRNVQKFWLKEINCYYFWDPSAGVMQLYLMVVFGPVFACMLARYWWPGAAGDPSERLVQLSTLLAGAQVALLFIKSEFEPRLNCCRCGAPDPLAKDLQIEPSRPRTKVCRGCRLVRYCSAECQLADWEKHKPVCKQFSAPERS